VGVSLHYWAVPPSSGLFKRLQRDRAFVTLMGSLFPYGRGVFFFFDEIAAPEREGILQEVISGQENVLGPQSEARRLIEEFRLELERTRLAYPGVEHRQCSLEKTSFLVEERLPQALKHVREDATAFVGRLLYGDQVHGALKSEGVKLEEFSNDPAFLCGNFVSPSLVKEGAHALSALDAKALFINDSVWQLQSFQRWHTVYGEAAAHGEALCGGVC
jgi:hypothetical protein